MRKFKLLVTLCLLLFVTGAMAQYYPVSYGSDKKGTHASRYIKSVGLTSHSQNDGLAQTKNYASSKNAVMYKTDLGWGSGFKANVDETVTPSISFEGSWQHGYIYVDKDNDGDFDVPDPETYTEGDVRTEAHKADDLLSYTFYSTQEDKSKGTNSHGTSKTNNPGFGNLPTFSTTGLTPGFYRIRYKVDWNNIDPKGTSGGTGNDIQLQGGGIYDLRLHVVGSESNLSAEATNCSVTDENGNELSAKVANGTAHRIKITTGTDCVFESMKIRYGYRFEGDASPFNGDMEYWREVAIDNLTDEDGDGTYLYEIPADYTQYDVRVTVSFHDPVPEAKAELSLKIEELREKVAVAGGLVDGKSQDATNAANAAIAAAQTVYDQEGLTLAAVNSAIATLESAIEAFDESATLTLETGRVYMFINGYTGFNKGKSMYSGEESGGKNELYWGDRNDSNNKHYWMLETKDDGYKVKNGDGQYIGGDSNTANGTGTDLFYMTNNESDILKITFGKLEQYQYNILKNGVGAAHPQNITDGYESSKIVVWAGGANGGSAWYIYSISSDYTVYDVVVTGDVPEDAEVTYTDNGDKAKNGGFFVVPTSDTAPTFTATAVDGYTLDMTTEGTTITVNYTLQSYIYYTLTDQYGNTYKGSTAGTPGTNAVLNDMFDDFGVTDIHWNGVHATATITFPLPVSKVDGTTNMTMISSFNNANHKWYADGTSVKSTLDAVPTSENIMSYLWAIYPTLADGEFTFTIKNMATDKYIYSTSNANDHSGDEVFLSETATALTLDGDQFKLPTYKYLSLNSSDNDKTQYIGTNASHLGTHNDFPAPTYKLTISSVGAATLYTPFAVTIPEGVTAKYVKAAGNSTANGGTLYYTTLEGAIPANTAVVLLGNAGDKTFNAATESVKPVDDGNVLFGYSELTEIAESDHTGTGSNGTVYALGNNNGTAVFGHFTGTTYKAGKAYLDVASLPGASNDVRYFYIFDEDTETGIDNVTGTEGAENGNSAIYDMSGRRVNNASKGIYIINGKKVIK